MKSLVRCLLALCIMVPLLSPTSAEAGPNDVPNFSGQPVDNIFNPATLNWNLTGEFIFPSVITTEHMTNPLGAYYLYTAPHDAPGGVALFYADSPDGPWTEYGQNPVLPNTFGVTHISSPHVMWNSWAGVYYMYFHGENTHTRWAWSANGINWTYGGISVAAGQYMHAASYARVFEHTIPRLGNRFVMVYTEEHPSGMLRLRYATSANGQTFTPRRDVLVSPSGPEGSRISSPTLLFANGTVYIAYHAASGNIHITEIGVNFDQEIHRGVLYDRVERVASPTFLTVGDRLHMYFERGDRLSAVPAHVSAPITSLMSRPPVGGIAHHGYFTDTPITSHYDDIYKIERAGITTGYGSATLFAPNVTITRGELATFLARALDLPMSYASTTFVDVPNNVFYTGPVEALRRAGIVSNGTHFRPNDAVTRQEMAVFIGRARGLTPAAGHYFTDVPQGTSFTGWIYAIYYAGITTGIGGGNTYQPNGHVTRQQMASFIARAFGLT